MSGKTANRGLIIFEQRNLQTSTGKWGTEENELGKKAGQAAGVAEKETSICTSKRFPRIPQTWGKLWGDNLLLCQRQRYPTFLTSLDSISLAPLF